MATCWDGWASDGSLGTMQRLRVVIARAALLVFEDEAIQLG
ncbi:MAG: hypothetical protein JWR73_3132 [Tardiphaga sp.]|nr:hypothetical protein [Tardiphaga sp.]